MSRLYRYRLPPWCRHWLYIIETSLFPILVFQTIRTLLFPTSLDVLLLGFIIGIFLCFRFKWL